MPFYKIHYPDGKVLKHKTVNSDLYLPELDKAFYNGKKYYQIDEMSEEEVWVEEISVDSYNDIIHKTDCTMDNFVYFEMRLSSKLVDY